MPLESLVLKGFWAKKAFFLSVLRRYEIVEFLISRSRIRYGEQLLRIRKF